MILDDEDILIDNVKETCNNPFLILSEYLKDFDINKFMDVDKNFVKKVLSLLNPPTLYNYKFDFEFKTDCIKLNLLNSNYKFVCTVLLIRKRFHLSASNFYLYFVLMDLGSRLYGEEGIIIRYFLKHILEKYNFDIYNTLKFKQ